MNDFERGLTASLNWIEHAGSHLLALLGFILPFVGIVMIVSTIVVVGWAIFDSQNWDDDL